MPPSPRESNPSSRSRTLADLTGSHHERFSPQPPADKRRDSCIVPRLEVVLHTFMPSRSPRGTPRLDMSASKKNQERHSGLGHGGHGLETGTIPTKLRARLPQAPGRPSRHYGGGDRQAQDETVHILPIDVREVPLQTMWATSAGLRGKFLAPSMSGWPRRKWKPRSPQPHPAHGADHPRNGPETRSHGPQDQQDPNRTQSPGRTRNPPSQRTDPLPAHPTPPTSDAAPASPVISREQPHEISRGIPQLIPITRPVPRETGQPMQVSPREFASIEHRSSHESI